MARFRLSQPAQRDLAQILFTSDERWGREGRKQYARILAAAMRKIALRPKDPTTQERAELAPGIRSLHLQHARAAVRTSKVRRPVHVIYYRVVAPDLIEIVRVLHEGMDPFRHLREIASDKD